MKKFLSIILAVILTISIASCGGNKLAGKWIAENGGTFSGIEFFSDGTYSSSESNYSGGYSTDGNRIRLNGILMPDITFTFKVKGDKLTFTDDHGDEEIYRREK